MHHQSEPSANAPRDDAIRWFSRLHSDDVTPSDRAQFEAWYQRSPAHAAAYERICALWSALDEPSRAASLELRGQAPELTAANALTGRRPLHRAKVWRWSLASLAAALALSVVGLILWLPGAWPVWFSDYHTNSGEQQTVQMADGSQIFLNVETAIAVDFSSERREVELLHGEAFFEVAPDPHRPFRVRARAGVITAQGTAFTVRIQRDEVTVAVTEGAVSVSPGLSGSVTSPLEAGWQASYRGGQMAPAHRAHLLRLLAWRRGQLVFQMQPLGEVIEEVSRYGAGTIVIANPWLRDLVVSGVFDIATPDRVLDAVEKTLQVRRLRVTGRLTFLY